MSIVTRGMRSKREAGAEEETAISRYSSLWEILPYSCVGIWLLKKSEEFFVIVRHLPLATCSIRQRLH